MGLIKNIIQLLSPDEQKAYTSLDLKSVPVFSEGGYGGGSGAVNLWANEAAWDRAITNALNNWGGSKINYANEIGDLRLSVLLMAAVRWAGINLGTGRIQVVEIGKDEKETPILDHPFLDLMKQPNPEITSKTMWKQFSIGRVLAGESYFLLGRDGADRITEMWYEPHTAIEPRWDKSPFPEDETANTFIQYFEIRRSGRWVPYRKKDVFRVYDLLDPVTRHGTNGVDALMRTIFTDQEREQYTALLLKNFGVTPKGVAPKQPNLSIDAPALAKTLQRRFSGDDRGKPTVFDQPMEVLDFSTDFSADAMEKIAHIAESRVSAALGISVQSLKFGAGQLTSTYNNVREYRREDYEQWVMPTHEDFLAAAENQILRDMDEDPSHVLRFDYSKVPIVQRDKMETAKETDILVRARVIDQSEARERHAYAFEDAKFKDVFYPVPATTLTLSPLDDSTNQPTDTTPSNEPTKAAKLPKIKDSELDDAADFWREHPALDDVGKSLIDATPYVNGNAS